MIKNIIDKIKNITVKVVEFTFDTKYCVGFLAGMFYVLFFTALGYKKKWDYVK